MKKLGKKIISLMIVLCIAVSMTVMAVPSAQAVPGVNFAKKKALDLGLRFACAAATQLAAQCENDDASIIVNSVIKYIISDAHGAATSEIKKMCSEILKELAILEEDVREYTSAITSSLILMQEQERHAEFERKWTSDVSGIVEKYDLNDILNAYTRYLIVSSLYANGRPEESVYEAIEAYWAEISSDPLSYKYEDCEAYKQDFLLELKEHVTPDSTASMSAAYESSQIFIDIQTAVEELTAKFVYDDVSGHAEQYSVIESAASLAYYALPFSSQQYGYIVAQAKRQAMVATLLEMALNEFLSLQGEYLVENDKIDMALPYSGYNSSSSGSMTYESCKLSYPDLTDTVLEETGNLFGSSITVNCKAYTGEPNYECTLDDYMKPEDAVAVNLTVNGYESKHYYSEEKFGTEMYHMYAFSNMTDHPSSIKNPTRFIRVMSGGNSGQVYYILDPSQYSDGSYLDFTQLKHDVKREYVTDGGVGDLHIVSCDYYNIIKQMTDGVNTYKLPSAGDINTKLHALIDVPSYFGAEKITLSGFLAPFAPSTIWGDQCSSELRVLTSSYDNNLKDGAPTAVKRADISVINANSVGANTGELVTYEHQIHEDLSSKDYSFLAVLAADSSNAFSQKVSLKLSDNYNAFDDYDFTVSSGDKVMKYGYDPVTFESGENLTIRFTVDDPTKFDSLKMVRKNVENSETVLLSGTDELLEFINEDGSYSFDVTMPYSEVEFVLTSHESLAPTAVFHKIDPAGTVTYTSLKTVNDIVTNGETVNVYPDTDITLKFKLNNVSSFKGFGTYNPETGEIEVLINKDSLSSHASGDYYQYTYTMPEHDIEFYIVTEEPEEFVPQELRTDEEGSFLIGNYEELRSAAYFMNTFEEKYLTGNYKVTADINCMNATLEQMVAYDSLVSHQFSGTFDGQGHTISNINIYTADDQGGLFGIVSDGEIKNLNLAGDFTVTNAGNKTHVEIGTLAYLITDDSVISNVNTDLTYKTSGFNYCEAVYGISVDLYGGLIENCFINSDVNMPDSQVYYSGICIGTGSYHTINVRNCGFKASLDVADNSEIYGILRSGSYTTVNIEDSYAYAEFTGGVVSPITQTVSSSTYNVTNTYFLEDMVNNATSIKSNDYAESKTKEQFASGEVAYLLNKGVTDGTEVWYQNLDNGRPADAYPVFEGGTVYKVAGSCISVGEGYTNTPNKISHNYNNYHVCKDCITLREGEAAGIYGFSIGLGGNISVNYYMLLDEDVAADPTAKMVFTVPSGGKTFEVTVPVAEAQTTTVTVPALGETRTLHIFECEVAAKEMASEILCQVVSDTDSSDIFSYTVKDYAEVILANPETFSKEIPLVKAMLNYGAEAQIAFGHNLGNLANTSDYITEEEKVLAGVDFTPYAYTVEDNDENISFYGAAISLKSETAIKLYFSFENPDDVANTAVTVNGKPYELKKNGTLYELKIADIPAHKLGENYEVKVGDVTLEYSVFSYCNSVSVSATDNGFANVGKALYAYNQAALTYKGLL